MTTLVQNENRPPVHRFIAPFLNFARLESSGSIVLLLATIAALLLANSALGPAYESLLSFFIGGGAGALGVQWGIRECVNDGLMAVFFLVVGLEVKREFVAGELRSPRRALLPVLAALGGVLTPALFYFALNRGGPGARGWGVSIATDVAFSLAVLAAFGKRVPLGLKVFIVALAIVDDIAGVAVIAVVYSGRLSPEYLAIAALLFVLCLLLNRRGVLRLSVYVPLGIALWWAMYRSGVHPTLAGILLALAIPSRRTEIPDSEAEMGEDQESAAPLQESVAGRLESALHPWVSFGIVPLFALVNADISLKGLRADSLREPIFLGLMVGLVLGKPAGITLFSWVAVRLRLAELPGGVTWKQLHAASWLGGIGFTVSIFIAGLAFRTEQQYTLARAAVLAASLCAAGVGACWLAVTCKRQQNST